jgi:hypothetical protein
LGDASQGGTRKEKGRADKLNIYIELINHETGNADEREVLLTPPQTVAVARILSSVFSELHSIDNPEIQYLAEGLYEYINADEELHEKSFAAFCDEVAAEIPEINSDDSKENASGFAPLDPMNFDHDVRVFLGRLLLSGEIVTPAQANQMSPFLGLICGLLSQYETEARRSQPDLVTPFRFAYRAMSMIAKTCDYALEQSRYLRISID